MEKELPHEGEHVRNFYSTLPKPVLVGLEATGSMRWFLQLLEELEIDFRVGHPAQIRAAGAAQAKKRPAGRSFAAQVAGGKSVSCDLDALGRATRSADFTAAPRSVSTLRTRVQLSWQSVALRRGLQRGHALWNREGQHTLRTLPMAPQASLQRDTLLVLHPQLQAPIDALDREVAKQAQQRPQAQRLMTHPGVGPITALATSPLGANVNLTASWRTLRIAGRAVRRQVGGANARPKRAS